MGEGVGDGTVVRVGVLGCGHVGSAVLRMLADHAADIAARAGVRIAVERVAVRDALRPRDIPVPAGRLTDDALAVVRDAAVDVVVELIGGLEPAASLIFDAFAHGKPVVTANKELLATRGGELFEAAARAGVDLLYEASVGGGIPLIRPLRDHLAGDRITRFIGIVNGTTNYVLTRMDEDGSTLEQALAEAQSLGYAERDPTADVEGLDAAAKAAILATIAFDVPVVVGDVHLEGIARVRAEDVAFARGLGYVIKLLAIGDATPNGVAVRVHPAMVRREHPLASVRGSFNAVFVEGERVGPLMLYGRGAGGDPTATSVVGDLIELARGGVASRSRPATPRPPVSARRERRIVPIEELEAQYYVLLRVEDVPGVLAAVALVFTHHNVSIRQVVQEGRGEEAQLVLITHRASERALQACVRDLSLIETVLEVSSVIRVEASPR